jgi:tetratricopeptide (TPR) repeat protein
MGDDLLPSRSEAVSPFHASYDKHSSSLPYASEEKAHGRRIAPVVWAAALLACAGAFYLTYRQFNSATQAANPPMPKELSAEAIFKQASPAVVRVEVRDRDSKVIGQGSGFLVSEDGLVATNHHVIEDAATAQVVLSDNTKYDVEGVASSLPASDLVLLKISGQQFPSLTLADDTLPSVGNKVYAIGNPRGLTNTLSDGLISGVRPVDDTLSLLQTTASISPGSSGGPLLSQEGKVIGVTTAFIQGGQNLNMVVPVRTLIASNDAQKLSDLWAAINKKESEKALQLADQLHESQKGSAPYWYAVGLLQSDLGNQEKAVDAWKASSKLDPNNPSTFFNLGCSYQALDRPVEAIGAYASALNLKPKYINAMNNIALANIAMMDYQHAIKVFNSVLAMDQNYERAHAGLGLAYLSAQQFEAAARSLEKAIAIDRNDATAYSMLGKARFEMNKYEEALEALRAAIRLNANDATAHTYMGRSFGRLARYAEAIHAFEAALHLHPKDAELHYFLGLSHYNAKELAKAAEYWQLTHNLDPNGQFGKEAQKHLEAKAAGAAIENAQHGFTARNVTRPTVPQSVYRNLSVGQNQSPRAPRVNNPKPPPQEHIKSPPPEPARKR